jgi:hypothetical protein
MGILRRLSARLRGPTSSDAPGSADESASRESPADLELSERAYELDLLREEQERLDELGQRQLRYADYAWQPPAQGGPARSDDADAGGER